MKTNSVKIVSGQDDDDIVLVMKKKKFPWWILLFLLPLILLIPIKRDIKIQFIDPAQIPVALTAAKITYPAISTFGSKNLVTHSGNTSEEGKIEIYDIKEPLWYRLFGGVIDSLYATCSNGCNALNNARYKYKDFKSDEYRILQLGSISSVETIKVVDADDNQPLPDCNIEIITIVNNNQSASNTKTSVSGDFDITNMPICGIVKLTASHEGYESDSLTATMNDLNNMSDNEKTIYLKPLKGSVKVIVKNLETKTLLADALVKLEINGNLQSMKTNTNGVGVGIFDSLRISNTLKFTASKPGYADTVLEGYTVQQFMDLPDDKRTMYLRPLTKSLVFINTDGNNVLEGVKNEIYKNGSLIATEYSNNKGEFVVNNILNTDKISVVASKTGYSTNSTKVKNKKLSELNTQASRTIPLTKKEEPKPNPPVNNRQDELQGMSGDLRINLQWYCKTDLDLHVIDPCGNEIYYSRRNATCKGGTGKLDVDANALFGTTSRPQENIYWVSPGAGTYTIKIVCFKWRERYQSPINYNVTIIDKNGRIDKKGKITDHQTVTVCKHTVD